jgi:hypothetical protein
MDPATEEAPESEEGTMTDHDVILEIAVMCLQEDDATAEDVLSRLTELGRSDLLEEAREMQAVLEAAEDEVHETVEEDEPE